MYYLHELTPSFLDTPAFRPPSNWKPLIKDTQLELYLSEIEYNLLKINEDGKNYPNLFKVERSALQDLMNDKNIIIELGGKERAFVHGTEKIT